MTQFGRQWATRAGAQIRVLPYDCGTGPEAVADADLWVIETPALPRLAEAGQLQPIPDSHFNKTEYIWQDLLAIFPDRLLSWKGKVYGLPLLGEAPLCFFRSDLFSDSEHKKIFREKWHRDLSPPTTWEEFLEIAAFFHQKTQSLDYGSKPANKMGPAPAKPGLPPTISRRFYGLQPLPPTDRELVNEFLTMAASTAVPAIREAKRNAHSIPETFSFHYNLATGEPRLATPGFIYALQTWQRMQAFRAPALGASPPESFARGDTVLCLANASWINRFQKSPAQPSFGICRIPGSQMVFHFQTGDRLVVPGPNYVPYLGSGSWLGVIPKTSAQSAAALALLSHLGSPEVSRQIVMEPAWGGGAFRRSHLSEKAWSTFRLDPGLTDHLLESLKQTLLHPGLSNPATCLRLPTERDHTQILAAELRAALLEGKEAASALKAAAAGWRTRDEHNPGTIRANYAYSLNLLPP